MDAKTNVVVAMIWSSRYANTVVFTIIGAPRDVAACTGKLKSQSTYPIRISVQCFYNDLSLEGCKYRYFFAIRGASRDANTVAFRMIWKSPHPLWKKTMFWKSPLHPRARRGPEQDAVICILDPGAILGLLRTHQNQPKANFCSKYRFLNVSTYCFSFVFTGLGAGVTTPRNPPRWTPWTTVDITKTNRFIYVYTTRTKTTNIYM